MRAHTSVEEIIAEVCGELSDYGVGSINGKGNVFIIG